MDVEPAFRPFVAIGGCDACPGGIPGIGFVKYLQACSELSAAGTTQPTLDQVQARSRV